MTDENDNKPDESEEAKPSGIDHMAEMAAAMKAEGVVVENDTEKSPETDHMAEMAAAMEAEGIVVENDTEKSPETNLEAGAPVEEMPSNDESIARPDSNKDINIDTLLKVPVSLAIEVGRTKMVLSDLLETQEGTVIELDRLLDDPLDILVNGALIAHGVIVLENESFGIQITNIISLEERARSL